MVRELRQRDPEIEIKLAALVVDAPVEIELGHREQTLDRVTNTFQPARDLIHRRAVAELEEGLRDDPVGVEIALVRADDVRKRLADRAVGPGCGE
jgi:hypothetical protein